MSGWINANGEEEKTSSNLHNPDLHSAAPSEPRFTGGWVSGATGELAPDVAGGEYTMRPNDDESRGIMSTVRTQAGSVIMGRAPRGSDVIKIEGMPIDLNNAAALGFVTRNPDGSFSDNTAPAMLKDPAAEARAKAPTAPETKEQTDGEPGGVSFGEAGDAAMADLIARQNPGDLFKTVDSVLHYGDLDKGTI